MDDFHEKHENKKSLQKYLKMKDEYYNYIHTLGYKTCETLICMALYCAKSAIRALGNGPIKLLKNNFFKLILVKN